MFREMMRNRLILGGIIFFVLVVAGSQLYSWHVRRSVTSETERTKRAVQALDPQKQPHLAVDAPEVPGVQVEAEMPLPLSAAKETLPGAEQDASVDANAIAASDTLAPTEVPAEPEIVSPHGFGPYPEIPADYPEHLMPFWTDTPNFKGVPGHAAGPFELMDRVLIKLWKQGHRNLTGASLSKTNGKIYPHYANTAYVQYEEWTAPDGEVHRFITKMKGGPDIAPYSKQIREGNVPAHITLIDYDSAGIDPSTFLKADN